MPATSKKQQRFMAMVRATQKGKLKDPSPEVARVAKTMKPDDARKFAKTKHEGLPEKKSNAGSNAYSISTGASAASSGTSASPNQGAGQRGGDSLNSAAVSSGPGKGGAGNGVRPRKNLTATRARIATIRPVGGTLARRRRKKSAAYALGLQKAAIWGLLRAGAQRAAPYVDDMLAKARPYADDFMNRFKGVTSDINVPSAGLNWANKPLAQKGLLSNVSRGDVVAGFAGGPASTAYYAWRYPKMTAGIAAGAYGLSGLMGGGGQAPGPQQAPTQPQPQMARPNYGAPAMLANGAAPQMSQRRFNFFSSPYGRPV